MSGVGVIFRGIVLIVGLFFLVLMAWMGGLFIDPFVSTVTSNAAVQQTGYGSGVELAIKIGLGLVIPLLGLALLVWVHIAQLRNDVQRRRI